MTSIPPWGEHFLCWLRDESERAWAALDTVSVDGWQPGTRWSGGLGEDELATIEAREGVGFSDEHRLLLRMLGSTTLPLRLAHEDIDGVVHVDERIAFYDWRNEHDIAVAFRFLQEVPSIPPPPSLLLPLCKHRYVSAAAHERRHPVVSVWQDIVVIADGMRDYLLLELGPLLDIVEVEVDAVDEQRQFTMRRR